MQKINHNLILYLSILIIVFAFLVFKNFPFHSSSTGWDNLHPEFNFSLNFNRVFSSSVWNYFQGLGTYGGHGYASVLPHVIITYLMSLVIPIIHIRSGFTFLMLFLGPLGVFFLVKKILDGANEDIKNKSALVSSLFYMLNLATIQQFYVQLEAFIVHFAALPWLFYSLANFLKNKTKKNLLIFTVISFLTSTQGFIPPLFVAYSILLVMVLLFYFFEKRTWERFKTTILILILTLFVNSFWLLPDAYYASRESATMANAYNTIQSTNIFVLNSEKYGQLSNAILLNGFLFQQKNLAKNYSGETFFIFSNWINHFSKNPAIVMGYALFVIAILGILFSLRKKNYLKSGLIASGLLMFALLANGTQPFSLIFSALGKLPIFHEAFRVPFTKFSISLAFIYSIFIGVGICWIITKLESLPIRKVTKHSSINLTALAVGIFVVYMALPAFKGDLIYNQTKIKIPAVYFKLFDFFKTQNQYARIADLPQGWPWGWNMYRWGYDGSGFLWYGIKQPIMDRAFDRWGASNENYYWELSYAIYSDKLFLLQGIFNKYDIRFIIFDKNSTPYLSSKDFLYQNGLESYLDNSKEIKLTKIFKSDDPKIYDIKIYEIKSVNKLNRNEQFITGPLKNILPAYSFSSYDQIYQEYNSYYSNSKKTIDIYYPFRNLFTGRTIDNLDFKINDTQKYISFTKKLPEETKNFSLILPPSSQFENADNNIYLKANSLTIDMSKNKNTIIYDNKNDPYFFHHLPSNCQMVCPSNLEQDVLDGGILRFSSIDTGNIFTLGLPRLDQRYAYLIKIESKHMQGEKLEMAIVDYALNRTIYDVYLPNTNNFEDKHFIVPPMKFDGIGYGLIFNNFSIGNKTTINEVSQIMIYKIPYQFLTQMKLVNPITASSNQNISLLTNSQSFNSGWKAYEVTSAKRQVIKWVQGVFPFLFGKELNEHVLVNNWANGWVMPESSLILNHSSLIIIFWPQYLEYLGFVILIGTFVWLAVLIKSKKTKS